MNLGLVTSFIIGGLLLVSMLMLNMSATNSATELTMTETTREKASTVSEMLSSDILKMGYNQNSKSNSNDDTDPIITIAKSNKIQFNSNVDNSPDESVETITWEFDPSLPANEVSSTDNTNDYILKRTVTGGINSTTSITLGVTKFEIKYYDEYGDNQSQDMEAAANSNLEDIRQLYIKLTLESPQKIYQGTSDDGRYIKSVWEKRFSPPNLEDTN